jgi:nucleoside-diphosphate-sugar epimerase
VTLVNVARGESASVEELIKIMAELLERNIEVQTDPTRFRRADKQIQIADTTLLRKLTGCSPLVTLRDGLRDLLAFEGFIK